MIRYFLRGVHGGAKANAGPAKTGLTGAASASDGKSVDKVQNDVVRCLISYGVAAKTAHQWSGNLFAKTGGDVVQQVLSAGHGNLLVALLRLVSGSPQARDFRLCGDFFKLPDRTALPVVDRLPSAGCGVVLIDVADVLPWLQAEMHTTDSFATCVLGQLDYDKWKQWNPAEITCPAIDSEGLTVILRVTLLQLGPHDIIIGSGKVQKLPDAVVQCPTSRHAILTSVRVSGMNLYVPLSSTCCDPCPTAWSKTAFVGYGAAAFRPTRSE